MIIIQKDRIQIETKGINPPNGIDALSGQSHTK